VKENKIETINFLGFIESGFIQAPRLDELTLFYIGFLEHGLPLYREAVENQSKVKDERLDRKAKEEWG